MEGRQNTAAVSARRGTKAPLVKELILDLIRSEGLRPGDRIPTEPELSERFHVSRATIREALKLLEQDGFVHAVQGSGRFVSPLGTLRVERPITIYESITEMLERLGYTVSTAVLQVAEGAADEAVAESLGIGVGDPVIRTVRLRASEDEEPLVLSVNVVPRACLPGPVGHRDWSGSLTSALSGHGHSIVSSAARISATNLPPDLGSMYDLQSYDPWLAIEETCMTQAGVRALHAVDYHRSSEIAFNVIRRR
ncbi:GntR family transcriptional regulator [Aeromicrobium sp. CTD01-1L150]|uniref:GntR family transcriptional regulator n=1 Tax=Aeromicrobium sp. CTD01-1L150 TaxID=3341830 RepID=UPI0035C1BFBB